MRISRTLIWILAALVVWLVLSFFLPALLRITGTDLWLLRAGLAILGIAAAIGYIWWRQGSPGTLAASRNSELDLNLREADARLRAAHLGSLADLPAVFVLGDTNSAKTTVILRSGLEPELLTGMAQRDGNVLPTGGLNVWLARGAILFDAAGSVWMNAGSRQSLFRRLASIRLSKVVAGSAPAPRSAVVCVGTGAFLAAGAPESMIARARNLRDVLGEISQTFGVRLPVYVLFTKLDELAHFAEYAGNFTDPEACEALGATLPLDREPGMEQETQRLTSEFVRLSNGLADQRLDLLAREHDERKLRSIYEFPREFGKLRSLLVQFLVELSRPSQLRVNPYLRGFYFTGLRAVVVNDSTPAPAAGPVRAQAFDPNATGVFMSGMAAAKTAPEPLIAQPSGRKIPQWVHLSRIFPHIVFRDNVALESSSSSVRVNLARRVLIGSAGALALVLGLLWTVSFSRNYSLATGLVRAARASTQGPAGGAVSLDTLKHLDEIREPLGTLDRFRRSGYPWSWGLGLYSGEDLYEPGYRAYFSAFRKLLLSGTQADLLKVMGNPAAAQNGDWAYVYEALKAYLITTSHPDKSTTEFLPRALLRHSPNGIPADAERAEVSSRQYSFYSEQLPRKNPFPSSSSADENAVQTARNFLKQSSTIEPLYQQLISAVNGSNPPFVFNKQYARSAEVIVNAYPVPFAFTKQGWAQMANRLENPLAFKGEEWVLGPDAYANVDPAKVRSELEARYRNEFVRIWREYLKATRLVGYTSLEDARAKLDRLSDNQSPLTAALCEASENTLVEAKPVADLFQPPQQVTPAGCRQSASGSAKEYLNALVALAGSVNTLISDKNSEAFRTEALMKATAADATVRQLARNFPIDKEGGADSTTLSILQSPILYARPYIEGLRKQAANAAGQGLCSQFNVLMTKYPFKRNSPEASVQEVADFFKPKDGALWRFYEDQGQKILTRQGSFYVPAQGAPVSATSAFAEFFSKAAAISNAFFPEGGARLALSFSIRVVPSDDILAVSLTIGQQTLQFTAAQPSAQRLTWMPGGQENTSLRVRFIGTSDYFTFQGTSSTWAPFDFFQRGERIAMNGSSMTFERTARDGTEPVKLSNGHSETVRLALDPGGAAEQLRPGYFPFSCPVPAVR